MSARPWYRRFPSDIISECQGLTAEERGIYLTLTDVMFARWRALDDAPNELARACGCSTKRFNVTLRKLVERDLIVRMPDGRISNERFEKEAKVAAKESQESIENGAKGGQKSAEIRRRSKEINDLAEGTPPVNFKPPYSRDQIPLPETEKHACTAGGEDGTAPPNVVPMDRKRMPRLSDPLDRWAPLCGGHYEIDENMVQRPVYAGRFLDTMCRDVCEAAQMGDPNWRGDWDAIMRWRRDGIFVWIMLDAIRERAAKPNYKPPSCLRYFDGVVRSYAARNPKRREAA